MVIQQFLGRTAVLHCVSKKFSPCKCDRSLTDFENFLHCWKAYDQQCKNFANWLRFDKVTGSLKVGTSFWDTVYIHRCGLLLPSRVAWFVGLSVTVVSPAKMAEPIEMPFGLRIWVDPMNHVLDRGSAPPKGRGNYMRERGGLLSSIATLSCELHKKRLNRLMPFRI